MISVLKVCDTFLKYGLPLMVMPPPGVFYPALLATDPVSVDRLAYIMYRWEYLLLMLHSNACSRFLSFISSPFIFFFYILSSVLLYIHFNVWFKIHSIKANSSDIVFIFWLILMFPNDLILRIFLTFGEYYKPPVKNIVLEERKRHTPPFQGYAYLVAGENRI